MFAVLTLSVLFMFVAVYTVKKIVDPQYDLAKQLLTDNKDMLEYIAKQLLEKETLDEKEFEDMMNEVRSKRSFDEWK